MRYLASEKLEIIRLVQESALPATDITDEFADNALLQPDVGRRIELCRYLA